MQGPQEQVVTMINSRLTKILNFAELAMPRDKFVVFRKLTLDEFGKSGLIKELKG